MKRKIIVLLIFCLACSLNADGMVDEIKQVSVKQIEKYSKKGIVVSKKELNEFLKKQNRNNLTYSNSVLIDSYGKYIKYHKKINKSSKINLSLKNLLKVTKFIFKNKLDIKRYEELKPHLLKKSLKYKFIDHEYFAEDVKYMNLHKINQILKELGGRLK